MYCACDYGDDVADVWAVDFHKARKRYKCCECGGPILPGERYEKVRSLYDHHWTVYRTCPRCIEIIEYVGAHVPCFKQCLLKEGLYDDGGARDTIERYAHEAPGLAFGFGRLLVRNKRFREANK